MSENLSQMVRETPTDEPVVFSESDLDLPTEEEVEASSEATQDEGNTGIIEIASLVDWFPGNVDNFLNIRKPTVSI